MCYNNHVALCALGAATNPCGDIEKHATLKNVDEWGKRKLAYLINKESEGYYVLFDFESTAEFPAELDRIYKITEGVMRSIIIKKEDE